MIDQANGKTVEESKKETKQAKPPAMPPRAPTRGSAKPEENKNFGKVPKYL